MKKLIPLLFILLSLIANNIYAKPINQPIDIQHAVIEKNSDVQVEGKGTVLKLLRDDKYGRKHQKFLLKLASGQTILIAHNIDLSTRIENLKIGDEVEFYGEYEWNNKGGVVHWTHHDPRGRHINGWLKHQGKTYQ